MKHLMVILALFTVPALSADPLIQQLEQCRTQSNDLERLQCYDKIELLVHTAAVSPAQAAAEAQPIPAPVSNAKEEFGLERKKSAEKAKEVQELQLVLKEITTNAKGLMVFHFDNGQVWRQGNKEILMVKAGDLCQLKRGALGTFYLNKAGSNRKTRVVRVK